MKQFLMKYLIGLGLIIGLVITMSPASSEAPASCHVEEQPWYKLKACNKVECINKDCSNSCKAHCKHN